MKGKVRLIEVDTVIEPEKASYPNGGMCHRCEYRAHFLEFGQALRHQCGEASISVQHCEAYRPVRPVVLKLKNDTDQISKAFSDDLNDSVQLKYIKVIPANDLRLRVIGIGRNMSISWMR